METDLSKVDDITERYGKERTPVVSILQDLQTEFNYLPREALIRVSERLEIPLSQVYSVATFYSAFSLTPRGRYTISVCLGTACHVQGGQRILEKLERDLDIEAGETTKDLSFSLEAVRCLGCCGLAPVVTIGQDLYGNVNQAKLSKIIEKYQTQGE